MGLIRRMMPVGAAQRDPDRCLHVSHIQDHVPGDDLVAFGERPVDDSVAAVADADLLAFLCWAQRRAATQYALPDQTHRELANPLHGILSLLGYLRGGF